MSKVASDDRDFISNAMDDSTQGKRQLLIEPISSSANIIIFDNVAQVNILGRHASIVEHSSHISASQFFAFADNLILSPEAHFLEMLGRLEDLDQAFAFRRYFRNVSIADLLVLDGEPCGLDVVIFDCFDYGEVAFGQVGFGFPCGLKETGRLLALYTTLQDILTYRLVVPSDFV